MATIWGLVIHFYTQLLIVFLIIAKLMITPAVDHTLFECRGCMGLHFIMYSTALDRTEIVVKNRRDLHNVYTGFCMPCTHVTTYTNLDHNVSILPLLRSSFRILFRTSTLSSTCYIILVVCVVP
jgi:hypothetical protein